MFYDALRYKGGDRITTPYKPLDSPVTWVGSKKKLRGILYAVFPAGYSRYIEVFGGSGNVLLGKPPDSFEVYNDFNGDLVNLFRCIRDRPMALIQSLGFLTLNSRDDFKALRKFFRQEEFHDDFLEQELELTRLMLPESQAQEIIDLRNSRAGAYDVRRASMYLRLIRTSYCSMGKSFASQPFDVAKLGNLIWDASRRLRDVVIENQHFAVLIPHYDRRGAFFYCDPPYLETEKMYNALFTWDDHLALRKLASDSKGYFLISYNDCPEIRELYNGFWFFDFKRAHYMAQKTDPGKEFPELLIANYDMFSQHRNQPMQISLFEEERELSEEEINQIIKECIING